MIALAPGTKVFLACQPIDLRAGFDGLAAKVQQIIGADPFSGHMFIFRSKRGHPTPFSIPIAICCRGVSLASAPRSAGSRLRPAGTRRAPDPLHRGTAGPVARDSGLDVRWRGLRSHHIG
jgi:IS66 Orf2 like protein